MRPVFWFISFLLLGSGALQLLKGEAVFGAILIVVGLLAAPAIYSVLL